MNLDPFEAGRIADRLAISDVLHSHSRGLDRGDTAAVRRGR